MPRRDDRVDPPAHLGQIPFPEVVGYQRFSGPLVPGVTAAVQIGVLKRVIAVDVTPRNPGHGLIILLTPVRVESRGRRKAREGCLSVPEYTANIKRAKEIALKGLDPEGNEVELASKGFEAVAFQHEIDHLDGILFIDRISSMKRDLVRRKDFSSS